MAGLTFRFPIWERATGFDLILTAKLCLRLGIVLRHVWPVPSGQAAVHFTSGVGSVTQIAGVLLEATGAQEAADSLVEHANHAGGGDNITAIVLRYAPKTAGAMSKIGRWFKASEDPS